ncbi:hypothetical protein [Chelativorans sp. M5D2P16]|uniref:hypothetical protein n=1 Tax=Chelativorans sp. M5D2P16 TaxID=3095678 RepID=UPI002ACA6089|nr:hypothetical protein [Chelativorans sp. M5D2P16]MDZ5696430.1 hypothetical protein [Chelativorans sp. M5D2P16]
MPAMPLFISYFTPDTPYEDRARNLTRSLSRLDLEHIVEPRPAKSNWVENCAQKALFIREIWSRVERPVCWVDADAVLLRRPHELEGLTCDFAVVRREGWNFFGGQIYFGKSEAARRMLDRWCMYCRDFPAIWDQVSLGYAWWDREIEGGVDARWLDEGIFEKANRNPLRALAQKLTSKAAFLQHQESRCARRKRKVLREKTVPEFKSEDVPQWWREACAAGVPFVLTARHIAELGLL